MYRNIVDCTRNQVRGNVPKTTLRICAIAYEELRRRQSASLEDSVALSEELAKTFEGVTNDELAHEVAVRDLDPSGRII